MGWKPPAAEVGADLLLGPEFQISEDAWEDRPGQARPPGAAGEPAAGRDGDAGSPSMRGRWMLGAGADEAEIESPTKAACCTVASSLLEGQQGPELGFVVMNHSCCLACGHCLEAWKA